MSRFVIVALALLAVSVSAQPTVTFYQNSIYCNNTAVNTTEAVQSVGPFALNSTCQPLAVGSETFYATGACDTTTGVVTVWSFTNETCLTLDKQINSTMNVTNPSCIQAENLSIKFDGCAIIATPTTAAPTNPTNGTVAPTNPTNATATPTTPPTTPTNATVAPTATPTPAGPGGAASSGAQLSAFAAVAVIVMAML